MKPRIALCMIVKNESHIIHECLNSIYKYIDYWIISDTGSTDGTQDIIKKFFEEKGIPGELHQDEQYPFMHVVPNNITPVDGGMQFDFQIIFADIPRDKELKAEYQREVISDCVRLAQDLRHLLSLFRRP